MRRVGIQVEICEASELGARIFGKMNLPFIDRYSSLH